jgi:hypothetical protein
VARQMNGLAFIAHIVYGELGKYGAGKVHHYF